MVEELYFFDPAYAAHVEYIQQTYFFSHIKKWESMVCIWCIRRYMKGWKKKEHHNYNGKMILELLGASCRWKLRVSCGCGYELCFLWLRGMSCAWVVEEHLRDKTAHLPENTAPIIAAWFYPIWILTYVLGFCFWLQRIIVQYNPWILVIGICRSTSCFIGGADNTPSSSHVRPKF